MSVSECLPKKADLNWTVRPLSNTSQCTPLSDFEPSKSNPNDCWIPACAKGNVWSDAPSSKTMLQWKSYFCDCEANFDSIKLTARRNVRFIKRKRIVLPWSTSFCWVDGLSLVLTAAEIMTAISPSVSNVSRPNTSVHRCSERNSNILFFLIHCH